MTKTSFQRNIMDQVIRFHLLKDTRDVDLSQLPVDKTYVHNVNDLVPNMNREEFVLQGYLPEFNTGFSDAEVRRYVAHMRLLQAIKSVDPEEQWHHVVFEDKVDIGPDFMTKHLALLGDLPTNYHIVHLYVFPQQRWMIDEGQVYETLPNLKGVCAYAVSPNGRQRILEQKPMTAPLDVMIRSLGLMSYTISDSFVEHVDVQNAIDPLI